MNVTPNRIRLPMRKTRELTRTGGDSRVSACSVDGIAISTPTLSEQEFVQLSGFVEQWTGVRLGENKRAMLLARLGMRLRQLKLKSIEQYLSYLKSERGLDDEKEHFIDVVTTHHTAFFREPEHFTVLVNTVLPTILRERPLRVLSAACSTGEELWTLGMTLAETIGTLDFELYGTDISRRALHVAQRGVYAVETIAAVADPLRLRWFMRSRNPSAKLVRVVPELRERASFAFANLTASHSRLGGPYDVIFLRNVLIYFDRDTQRKIIGQIVEHLKSKGWLFVGLSETADGLGLPLQRMGHSVYRRLT